MDFKIGNIDLKNKVVLAPMADISNYAFMKIVEEMGASLVYTELISAEAIIRNNQKTLDMLKGIEKLKIPVGVQLFGSNPQVLSEAAKIVTKLYKNVFIDINMGCPVPKVALKSQAGSALLKDIKKIEQIVSSVVKSVNVPVTVKIRSGWDEEHINAKEVAETVEKAGASAITIHPRTRKQGYSGLSDWNIIKEVKENVKITVIGNGDIKTCYDAKKMLEQTNCDAIMIGRACLGNPWLIKQTVDYLEKGILPTSITIKEKIEMIKKHMNYLLEIKDEKVALLEMRGHACWYLKGIPNTSKIKQLINKVKTKEELISILNEYEEE